MHPAQYPQPDPSLWNDNLKPVPPEARTWNRWHLAALWVGMAVCIPTYMLASFMIRSGIGWVEALLIIAAANAVITLPMVLNGKPGVKYGLSFPVLGRAAFGTRGIYLPSLLRALVACGWFGVQTWVGGTALWSIWNAATGNEDPAGLDVGEFICFGLFWFINIWFILKGTERIKWLENLSAPFLIIIGALLIGWGAYAVGGFSNALSYHEQLRHPGAVISDAGRGTAQMVLHPITDLNGKPRATHYRFYLASHPPDSTMRSGRFPIEPSGVGSDLKPIYFPAKMNGAILHGSEKVIVHFYDSEGRETQIAATVQQGGGSMIWAYVVWFTAMMGFWATMSISISDITRYARSQADQVAGQFLGLPGTMVFYSFAGIFVTCAAVGHFSDILVSEDAPWDPVQLLSRFESPALVIFAQFCMIIATLTTNIAANVIAPANVFSNLWPRRLSFTGGGVVTGIIGIAICPWWLMDQIGGLLVMVSALLAPVVSILLCDYFIVRKQQLNVEALYRHDGEYGYGKSGINPAALIALLLGAGVPLCGLFIPALEPLYSLAWFTGFFVAGVVYLLLMRTR